MERDKNLRIFVEVGLSSDIDYPAENIQFWRSLYFWHTAGNASYIKSKWGHFKHQWSYLAITLTIRILLSNQNYELQVTQGATVIKKFSAIVQCG
jgi:hypothetical protein